MEVTNRFKGLDLINSVPEELQVLHDIVQETANKTIPKKRKSKKAKWLSEETLQIAGERREVESKGEGEVQPTKPERQRTAQRDEGFFHGQ